MLREMEMPKFAAENIGGMLLRFIHGGFTQLKMRRGKQSYQNVKFLQSMVGNLVRLQIPLK